jgi:hypothetical protein
MSSSVESPLRAHLNARPGAGDGVLLLGSRIAFFVVLVAMTVTMLASGCAVGYTETYPDDGYGPDLVYAAPGVQVVADYNEPVFFSDGFYWRYSGGYWYRSSYYNRGWISARPPAAVLSINRPQAYVHYRPQGWAPRGRAVPQRYEASRGAPPPRTVYGAPPPRAPAQGWRGAPVPPNRPVAPVAPRAQPPQGWRGAPSQVGAPPQRGPAPQRAAPQRGGGEHHDGR